MEFGMDVKEIEAVGKSLSKIGAKSGQKVAGALTASQAKEFWRGPVKRLISSEARKRAPASGLKGKAVWRKGPYKYEGKHGLFRLKAAAVQAGPFKSGVGSYFSLGGRKTKFGPYAGVVGKFATFNVRRRPGGKAVKEAARPWLIDAINASGRRAGSAYVKLIENAIQTEIDKGVRRAA